MDFNRFLANRRLVTMVGVVLVAVIVVVWIFASLNSNQKTMVTKESALSAQYKDNQNELSSFISTVHETLGVADSSTAALDKVLVDAVKGRYEGSTGANPTGGAYFSAITEAYPDLSQNQTLYAKVQDAVISGRTAYKNVQSKLLDMIRDYTTWKNAGLVHSKMTSLVGAPSGNLEACVGADCVHGEDALDRMKNIVLASQATQAYQTGTMDPMDLGPSASPTDR